MQASKHALDSARYWKGAFGRAHSNLRKSALKDVNSAKRAVAQGLVQSGHDRQGKGQQQRANRQLMSSYHGQLNMLGACALRTDLQHR